MDKLDLVKKDKYYYTAKSDPDIRTFDQHAFLSLSGQGAPGGEAFISAVESIIPLAYGIKKNYKLAGKDFAVPKLEALWWVVDSGPEDRSNWKWQLLIRLPDYVEAAVVERSREETLKKKKNPRIQEVEFLNLSEGKCVQVLHIGPYSTEHITLDRIQTFMQQNQLVPNGPHHEIYLSDPRKSQPEKMKTILRQPVKRS
jgi:hypothetical protein